MFLFPVHGLYADDEADEYINGMTLEEKIGQIMLIGIKEKTLSSKTMDHLKKINPGGIVFYGRNVRDASEIPPLISKIKSIFRNNTLPLFFATDQEGGIVHRIEGEYHKPPSAPAIGAVNSAKLAREIGLAVGTALRDLGINVNLAPVLDVPVQLRSSPMTRRSFSNDPLTVARLGTAYITGLHDAGILAAAKHFPGIGRTDEDTHKTLPRIAWKTDNEKHSDLMPFEAAIKTGVDMIMVGHFIAEPGDSKHPVSLSTYWMTDVLKKEMGFQGLVLVDNIEMKPIAGTLPIGEAAVRSFNAGADIIMVSHERENQEKVFEALFDAAAKGEISAQRLTDSLKRIIVAKKKILSHTTRPPGKNLKELSQFVAEESVMFLSLKDAPFETISRDDRVLFTGYETTIYKAIKKTFPRAEILNTTLSNYKKLHPETPIEDFLGSFDVLIIDATYTDTSRIIELCHDLSKNYVVLETRLSDIQNTLNTLHPKNLIITFEKSREHLKVALEILCGLRKARGKLPYNLSIPSQYTY